jgi:23S rRNA (guanosine2251-2'-O)-methyltransferase
MNAARRPAGGGGRKRAGGGRPNPAANKAQGRARPPKSKVVPTRSARKRIGVTKSQAAGRTGRLGDETPKRDAKGLGGQQVEGRQAVRELLVAGRRRVHELWLSADLADDEGVADIVALAGAGRVPVAHVAKAKLAARAHSEAPQGVIAFAAELPEADLNALMRGRRGRRPFLVAVDGVTDPGNLGAILRSCDGAGVDGVVIPRHRAVHVTPTVAKAAAGAVEHVPIALVGGLPATLTRLRDAGIWVVGLDDAAERSLFELGDLTTDGICLVLGAEGAGLSRLVRERCDAVVAIPMRGRIGSLNVSAAAALATYEVARHR